jgi:hypothetical protein
MHREDERKRSATVSDLAKNEKSGKTPDLWCKVDSSEKKRKQMNMR